MMLLALLLVLSLCSDARSTEPSSITIQYRVWEEQPTGTRVGRLVDDLRQRDESGLLEDFQVVEHGKALPFSVSTRDGVVSTQGRLDREELCRGSDLCELAFSVLYRKSGAVNCLRVRVEVMDLNDHSPSFPSTLQEVEISETASLRMRIPLDRAVDPDAGPNSLQTYSLSVNQHFALDVTVAPGGTKQAELVVIKELDREVQDTFDLILVAWDKGNPPRSGSTLVRVNIQDSNDNSPVFEDSTPTVELSEDTARGTTIINLKATDPDQGANGEVEYSLSKHTRPEVQRLFYVDPQSGAVSLKAPLDYEAQPSYEVIIQARDRGPNAIPTHCKLHVKLQDVNDNAPRIHMTWTPPNSPVATVLEGAPLDTFLALVMVSDADSGENGKVRALIQEESGPFRLKRIHGDNYMIVTDGSLDREKVMQYNITLLAQDYGDPPLSCVKHLPVHVLDENDNAPVFSTSLYKASVKENNVAGLHALKVEAHDVDLEFSGRVSYFIRNPNKVETDTESFSINPTSGVISVQRPLDYEESRSYSFMVEAVDQGHPPLTSTASVQIDIQDVNDNYPVIKEPKPRKGVASLSVPVNTDKGEIVTELGNDTEEDSTPSPINHLVREGLVGFLASTIKAEDPDSGLNGQLSYLITDGNPDGLFWLDQMTGQLFVNTTNATELIGKTFKVNIAVSDMGTPSLSTKATLEVTFINLRDHLKNSSPGTRGQLSFTMMMAICLGATCLLLLLAIALVTTFCRPEKRDSRAYNCRQAESTYTRHPRRPQKNIRKSDIQLIPVIRGRKEEPLEDDSEAQPLAPPPMVSDDPQTDRQYTLTPSVMNTSFHSQGYPEGDQPATHYSKTLRKPGNIELDGTLPLTPASSYRSLRKARNPSSSSSVSHSSTLKRQAHAGGEEAERLSSSSQATLRRPRTSEGRGGPDAEHRQMLRNLVRLSMAAFGDSIELSSASPEVQQISQLLSLLRQGQLQPRPNFRGNKYSHRNGRYGGQDCSDWQSTKDSGHGESEAGDVDWEPGRDSPIDPQLEEGLNHLLNHPDDVFSEVNDPAWMARLSLPLTSDYHDNVFVPNGPPSTDSELLPRDALDSSSFSTFGKSPEKDGPLGGALLSEVSTLFEMLMTQKADSHPGPRPDVLYRLSAAYRRSLGLDANAPTAAGNTQRNSGNTEKRSGLAAPSGLY
ncbi:protocadherin-12-like [Epinephelus fuscoguttatus]|uniref:protocadherin-12-like n=1 Tax=Epinephelus fuscoguttatus TaxID=293821 RepID=UPI0020D10C3C|nr:protocadherin-12-like isoform X1 [Epinephelus fuscoguttatus]XP_049442726.1 protocadherin-12-like [Epinephelus fuscoguttatus]